ncbi:uncharacterized protein LOC143890566 [Tasmannia lanceolata]|uniref:uncharacterized protein LOC143890566 n=1 Tax=Tasmannia lanceolata TaxID=3420 RepID=UPI0040633F5C
MATPLSPKSSRGDLEPSTMQVRYFLGWVEVIPCFKFVSAYELWEGWLVVCFNEEKKQKIVHEWAPLDTGFLKLNFDWSSLGNPGPAGIGGVLRNDRGELIWAFAGPIGVTDSTEAEVRAAHQGIKLFVNERLSNVVIEGDSPNVIRWLNGAGSHPWRFDYHFDEMLDWMRSSTFLFRHVRRSANSMADALARDGVTLKDLAHYDSLPP